MPDYLLVSGINCIPYITLFAQNSLSVTALHIAESMNLISPSKTSQASRGPPPGL